MNDDDSFSQKLENKLFFLPFLKNCVYFIIIFVNYRTILPQKINLFTFSIYFNIKYII